MIPLVNKNANKRTAKGFKACVDKIGCEPETIEAVIAVEAAWRGWDRQGRLRILFEPHVFYRVLARNAKDKLPAAVSGGARLSEMRREALSGRSLPAHRKRAAGQ